jgi:hypothetical protein
MISLACRIREAHPTSLPWQVGTLPLTHLLPKRQSIQLLKQFDNIVIAVHLFCLFFHIDLPG